MPKHLTKEIKEKVTIKYEQGLKAPIIAKHLMISKRSVYEIIKKYKNGEDLGPHTANCGRKACYDERHEQIIIDSIAKKPDITLNKLIDKTELEISESTMSRIVKKLGYKRKKGIYVK